MKRITNKKEFIRWAEQVNHCSMTPGAISELQDVFARSDRATLQAMVNNDDNDSDRRMMIFGIYKAMGHDTFFDYINFYIRGKVHEIMEGEEKKLADAYLDIANREAKISKDKESIKNKVNGLIDILN